MSDVPQTLALLILEQTYRGDIIRQINRSSVLLKLLRIVPGGGLNVAWAVESSGQVAENYTDGADASNFGSDAEASAILAWALERSNFRVTDLARRAAATSGTPGGIKDLVGRNMTNAAAALASRINGELYTGPGTGTRIAGLDVAIGDDSNTYATIDRSSASYWRPKVVNPGASTPLTLAQIRSDLAAINIAGGIRPDIALCHPNVFNTVVNLFEPTRRRIQDVTVARGVVKLDAGYGAVEVDGCLFFEDKDATDNKIYYLRTDHVEIVYLPPDPTKLAPARAMLEEAGIMVPMNDGYGEVPLGMLFEHLARAGASDKYSGMVNLQLKVEKPNTCGVRLNVATS